MSATVEVDWVVPDVLLCDADGNLFPSEEPAFAASASVTNLFLRSLGVPVTLSAEHLRTTTTGKNFRTTAVDLCIAHGVEVHDDLLPPSRRSGGADGGSSLTPESLEEWVLAEAQHVTAHLAGVLRPDPAVCAALESFAATTMLAVVSNSAGPRVSACLRATGLDHIFPDALVFSAETSLNRPTPKPDPAIYRHAVECTTAGRSRRVVAVEDSATGVQSAVAAGVPVIGNLSFVRADERVAVGRALTEAGACRIVGSWDELEALLGPGSAARSGARTSSGRFAR